MKRLPVYATVMLLVTLLIAVIPTDAEASIYDDTVRLHILAASDSKEDQELKLAVRDMILTEYGRELASAENKKDAEVICLELADEIEAAALAFIKERGFDYSVGVTVTEEWYDTRDYEDFSLPSGYYSSLRVIIGEGDGKNWWCVMYPPLCREIATESAPADDGIIDYTDEEIRLIEGGRDRVKFKILELISGLFNKSS